MAQTLDNSTRIAGSADHLTQEKSIQNQKENPHIGVGFFECKEEKGCNK
ncbi:MAG: hypothetical protein IPN72_08650 [Saprospiraceae bacterium]|nr:hypothetical protein [Saprospiraceae bacterium]